MGLDQAAGWTTKHEPLTEDEKVVKLSTENDDVREFDWRKHARLQQYMMELWHKKKEEETPFGVMSSDFNCENLYLEKEDILDLKEKIKNDNLPFCPDGFFWGHQFQEDSMKEYKAYDLQFCEQALKWLDEGKRVWYSCWW